MEGVKNNLDHWEQQINKKKTPQQGVCGAGWKGQHRKLNKKGKKRGPSFQKVILPTTIIQQQ